METIVPLREQVVVEPVELTMSKGGIHLPPSAMSIMKRGKVVAKGDFRYYAFGKEPVSVQIGDIVLYADGSGFDVTVEDKNYRILPESSIVALIKEAN